ncbi:MAG: hypothetical protein ACKO1M_05345 [Planctomycetota bacterium]
MPHDPRRLATAALLALLAGLGTGHAAVAREPVAEQQAAVADKVEFLRLSRDADGELESLDTSIVAYTEDARAAARAGRKPVTVDLVAAVHLGGGDYYETLDRLFADYDAVLYELVAPPNERPRPGRKPAGAIGSAQQGLTKLLGLEFQLESIDYTAANFVHADLSPREFQQAMKKRGESWWSMFTKIMSESMARAERGETAAPEMGVGELFGLLFGGGADRQVRLRRIMAEQFSDMDVLTSAFGGEEGSTLITDRNAAALAVLEKRIARGDHRIAIFYGAAHMDDFDRRLREDFSLQPGETVWLEAWDLRPPTPRK